MNAHETLGVPRGASDAEIRRAYRRKMAAAHPDRDGGDAELAARLNAARDELLGSDDEATDETRAAALAVLGGMVQKALGDRVKDIARQLKNEHRNEIARTKELIAAAHMDRRHVEAMRKNYVFKGKGDDAVGAAIDRMLASIDDMVASMAKVQAVSLVVGELIEDYGSPEFEVPPGPQSKTFTRLDMSPEDFGQFLFGPRFRP